MKQANKASKAQCCAAEQVSKVSGASKQTQQMTEWLKTQLSLTRNASLVKDIKRIIVLSYKDAYFFLHHSHGLLRLQYLFSFSQDVSEAEGAEDRETVNEKVVCFANIQIDSFLASIGLNLALF